MLQALLGNATAEKVLLYLEQYEEGYATAIAETFGNVSLDMVQRQLARFERAGLLVSTLKGRTRLYRWNPMGGFSVTPRRRVSGLYVVKPSLRKTPLWSQKF